MTVAWRDYETTQGILSTQQEVQGQAAQSMTTMLKADKMESRQKKETAATCPVQMLQMMIYRPERQDRLLRRQRATPAVTCSPECNARGLAQVHNWAHAYRHGKL